MFFITIADKRCKGQSATSATQDSIYTIIEYTQRIHVVQHGNVSSHTRALLLNAAQTETTIKHIGLI